MTTDSILIGLAGRIGSGKSTLASILAKLLPDTRVVAFADALKDDVLGIANRALLKDFDRDDLEREKAQVWGPLLQGWGELCRRTYGEDYWIERLIDTLPKRAIIADLRYDNEAAFVKCQDGLIVYVDGPDRREGDVRSTAHRSELKNEQPWGDVLVNNSGTIQHLRDQARCIVRILDNLSRTQHMAGVS